MTSSLYKTPLFDLHRKLGAKLVSFAGYEMPVQYAPGILREHRHTRQKAGLFDVSHMGQIRISGKNARKKLEELVPVDIVNLPLGTQRYAFLTTVHGGILDDLMVTNFGDHLYLVVNATRKQVDLEHLKDYFRGNNEVELLDRALIALQGPEAAAVLATINPEIWSLKFMQSQFLELGGTSCIVSRSGYTGEDGFEISVEPEHCEELAEKLLCNDVVQPIGLGARDSLRLEAGLCLYGHDIDETTSPIEANLLWALSRSRRVGGTRAGGYLGANVITKQLTDGVPRKRVGLKPNSRAPVREGIKILDGSETPIGIVTSGGFGPSVDRPIAMGYVSSEYDKPGTNLYALVRNKKIPITVTTLPFSPHRYYRGS